MLKGNDMKERKKLLKKLIEETNLRAIQISLQVQKDNENNVQKSLITKNLKRIDILNKRVATYNCELESIKD